MTLIAISLQKYSVARIINVNLELSCHKARVYKLLGNYQLEVVEISHGHGHTSPLVKRLGTCVEANAGALYTDNYDPLERTVTRQTCFPPCFARIIRPYLLH